MTPVKIDFTGDSEDQTGDDDAFFAIGSWTDQNVEFLIRDVIVGPVVGSYRNAFELLTNSLEDGWRGTPGDPR